MTMPVAWHELEDDEVDGEEGGKLEDELGTDDAAAQMDAGEAGGDEVVEEEAEEEKAAIREVEAEEGI